MDPFIYVLVVKRILLDSRDASSAANPHCQSRAEDAGKDGRGGGRRRRGVRGGRRLLQFVSGREEGARRREEGRVEESEAEVARKRKQIGHIRIENYA